MEIILLEKLGKQDDLDFRKRINRIKQAVWELNGCELQWMA